jgi:hypothetical protein
MTSASTYMPFDNSRAFSGRSRGILRDDWIVPERFCLQLLAYLVVTFQQSET